MDFGREQILKNALEDKDIKALIEHNQISGDVLEKEILSIYSYMLNKKKCAGCTSIDGCSQDLVGQMPKIMFNGNIYTEYVPCPYLKKLMDKNEKIANLTTLACNLDNVDATSLFNDKPARKLIYTKMMNIFNKLVSYIQPIFMLAIGAFLIYLFSTYMTMYMEKHYNWFRKLMYKLCFDIKIEDVDIDM